MTAERLAQFSGGGAVEYLFFDGFHLFSAGVFQTEQALFSLPKALLSL
jgi:hypothetical protein